MYASSMSLPMRVILPCRSFATGSYSFGGDRVHFCNDPARVRLDHLRAVAEVNFVAVIVRWVMTCSDHDAGICPADNEPQKKVPATDRGPSNTNASQPFSDATLPASSANSLEKNRGSCAITIVGFTEIPWSRWQS